MLLARDEERIEHFAAVVDGNVTKSTDAAGLGVDLDDRHVSSEGEGRSLLVEVHLGGKRTSSIVGAVRRRSIGTAHVGEG